MLAAIIIITFIVILCPKLGRAKESQKQVLALFIQSVIHEPEIGIT